MSVTASVPSDLPNSSTEKAPRSHFRDAWRRLLRSWNGRVGLLIISLTILIGVLAPVFDHYDPTIDSNLAQARFAPSFDHPFGTDRLGRDVFRRIIHGTRISVELLMERLADGWTMEQILASYPRVTRNDVLAAIAFVTEVFREEEYVAIQKASA